MCKGVIFYDFLFAFVDTKTLEKGSTLKGKNLLPFGSKFFHFRVDPFLEGIQNNFDRVASPESVSIPLEIFSTILEERKNHPFSHDVA